MANRPDPLAPSLVPMLAMLTLAAAIAYLGPGDDQQKVAATGDGRWRSADSPAEIPAASSRTESVGNVTH